MHLTFGEFEVWSGAELWVAFFFLDLVMAFLRRFAALRMVLGLYKLAVPSLRARTHHGTTMLLQAVVRAIGGSNLKDDLISRCCSRASFSDSGWSLSQTIRFTTLTLVYSM